MSDRERKAFLSQPLVRVAMYCSACALLVIGGIAAANFIRNRGTDSVVKVTEIQLDANVTEASEQCEQQNFAAAVRLLTPLRQAMFQQEHLAGLKVYAKCQEMVPLESNAHITLAASTLVHIASVDSSDLGSRLRLFELFRQLGDHEEACRYGDEAVALAGDDHQICLRVARAHLNADQPQVAQRMAQTILTEQPQHIPAASLIVECMVAADVESAEIVTFIDDVCRLQTRTAQLDRALLSLVLANAENDHEGERLLTSMLKSDNNTQPLDGARTQMLVSAFDSAGRTQDALMVAERGYRNAEPDINDASRIELLYRYLWAGEHQRLQQSISAYAGNGEQVSDEVLIIHFFSCWLNNQRQELAVLAQQLSERKSHRADCWQPVLASLTTAQLSSSEILPVVVGALQHYPQSPVLRFLHAMALQSLGDHDAAVPAYRIAIALSPRWSTPRIALSRLQLDRGNHHLAFSEAVEAIRVAPQSKDALNAMILSAAKMHADGAELQSEVRQAVLHTIQKAEHKAKDETSKRILLATHQSLGQQHSAVNQSIGQILQKPDGLCATDFELLSTIAFDADMKRQIDFVRTANAADSMEGLLAKTARLLQHEGVETAREYLNAPNRSGGQPLAAVTRELLLTEALSAVGSPDAKSSWVHLAERFDKDLQIQARAANARELATDFELRQQINRRLEKLSPPDGILWRIEATRLLLDQDTTEQAAARAALTMTDVLEIAPSATAAYLLAVRAYDRLGRKERVLDLCRKATSHGVVIPQLVVHLAESTKSGEEAVRTARSIVASRRFSELQRRRAIAVLFRHQDYEFAADAITAHLPAAPEDSDDYFGEFSTLAIARANHGSIDRVRATIEFLAPQSDRWFQLWLDISQISRVAPEDASVMLQQAAVWLSSDQPHRHRSLSIAWRRLAKRSRDAQYLKPAYEVLSPVGHSNSSAEEQMLLATLALKTNDRAAAMQHYQQICDQHRDNIEVCSVALNNLATLKLEDPAQLDAAGILADRAYAMLQKPEIIDTLIEVRLRQDRRPEAIELLNEGLQKWPRNRHLQRLVSRIHSEGDRT